MRAVAAAGRRLLELKIKAAEQKVLAGNDPGAIAEHMALVGEHATLEMPPTGRCIADDATPEALARMMGENGGRMSVMSAEGQVFDAMAGQYLSKGQNVNMDVYLKAFSGDTLRQDRVGREAVVIDSAVLTIAVCTQPGVLAKLAQTPELAARGATARFMYSIPDAPVGERDRSKIYVDIASIEGWNGGVRYIGERFAAVSFPSAVSLTSEAAERFTAWDQSIENQCGRGGPLRQMVEWIQKLRSAVLRVAGLLAVADGEKEIDLGTIERALEIGGYWLDHAKVVHRMWGVEDVDLHIAKRMVGMLEERFSDGGEVSFRDLYRVVYHDPRIDRKRGIAEEVAPAVDLLVEHQYLHPHCINRGRSPLFLVPRLAV